METEERMKTKLPLPSGHLRCCCQGANGCRSNRQFYYFLSLSFYREAAFVAHIQFNFGNDAALARRKLRSHLMKHLLNLFVKLYH